MIIMTMGVVGEKVCAFIFRELSFFHLFLSPLLFLSSTIIIIRQIYAISNMCDDVIIAYVVRCAIENDKRHKMKLTYMDNL